MNILLVSNMYPSEKSPTFGSFIQKIEKNLSFHNDCNVEVVAISNEYSNKILLFYYYLKFIFKCFFLILKQRHDVVYVHFVSHSYIPFLFLPRFLIKKMVINFHGSDLNTESKLFQKINAIAIRKANLIIVPSKYFKKLLLKIHNTNEENIFISPSGGIPKYFYNKNKLHKRDYITCGYVGRVIDKKGWKTFVNAISDLDKKKYNVKGIIVGPGNLEIVNGYIMKLKTSNNINYLGAIPNEKLSVIFEEFDLFIFPTMFNESLGLAPLEAMAHSIPAICSNCDATSSYIMDGVNGFLFEKGNAKELSEKIIKFINLREDEKNNFRDEAYEKALEYRDIDVSEKLYNKLKKI